MAAFTVFFCGTSSNSFDFANTVYHSGELVSTLARQHEGMEFVDWIIVDGPGSGNHQAAALWVKSQFAPGFLRSQGIPVLSGVVDGLAGAFDKARGVALGMGWEENVAHAVAVLAAKNFEERTEHTPRELKQLGKAGVDVPKDRPRITPQALQQKKAKIFRHQVDCVNVVGWSRGGVTAHMFANALHATPELSRIPVNIFAVDPVPGLGNYQRHRLALSDNVANYVGVYSCDERSIGFEPVLPALSGQTTRFILRMPGRHATLVGNAAHDGSGKGIDTCYGPGQITRHLAEKYLTDWGTPLGRRLNLSDMSLLKEYDKIIAMSGTYEAMHKKAYTVSSESKVVTLGQIVKSGVEAAGRNLKTMLNPLAALGMGRMLQEQPRDLYQRRVVLGNDTFVDLDSVQDLAPDPVFVNKHHRGIFESQFRTLHGALFRNQAMSQADLRADLDRVLSVAPHLARRINAIPVRLA